MRLIAKLILLLFTLIFGVYLYTLYEDYRTVSNDDSSGQEKEHYISHSAYLITNNENLKYNLPANATNFKLLIYPIIENAIFLEQINTAKYEKQIEFSLDFDYAGNNKKQDYTLDFKRYTNQKTGEFMQPFWLNDESNVMLSKTVEFEVTKDKTIAFTANSDTVKAYLVRAYYQQRQSKTRVTQRWQRASDRRKSALLKYYPFDDDIITNSEISSLYKNSWSSIAPSQDNNSALNSVRLFEYESRENLIADSTYTYSISDIYLPKSNKYTFKSLDELSISLKVQALTEDNGLIANITHKSEDGKVRNQTVESSDFNEIQLKAGQYEISFTQDVSFTLDSKATKEKLVLPDAYRSMYSINKGDSISYAVKSLPNIKAYYKATFYALDGLNKAKVQINTYAKDELLNSKTEELHFNNSAYMPFLTSREDGLQTISEALEKTIFVNDRATRVEIIAIDQDINLQLSNTVSGLAAIKKITKNSDTSYQNSWFVLKPEQALEFLRDSKVHRYLYIESNAIKTDRVAQSFEKIRPLNSRRFKNIFYHNKRTINSGQSALNFRKLISDSENNIQFQDKRAKARKTIKPTILVSSSNSKNITDTTIYFDGQKIELNNTELLNEHLLPKIEVNKTYNVVVPDQIENQLYINYTSVPETLLAKRQYFKAKNITKYRFYKRGNIFEGLSIHLQSNKANSFEMMASLYKNGQLIQAKKTTATRKFIFDAYDELLTNSILHSSECAVNCYLYTPQFIPLYEDLDAGWYELRIETPSQMQLYIDLAKTYYQSGSQSIIFTDEI